MNSTHESRSSEVLERIDTPLSTDANLHHQVPLGTDPSNENVAGPLSNIPTGFISRTAEEMEEFDGFLRYLEGGPGAKDIFAGNLHHVGEELFHDSSSDPLPGGVWGSNNAVGYGGAIAGTVDRRLNYNFPCNNVATSGLQSPNESETAEEFLHPLQHQNWKVSLQNEELWRKFHEVGNEMVLTKAGR